MPRYGYFTTGDVRLLPVSVHKLEYDEKNYRLTGETVQGDITTFYGDESFYVVIF